MKTKFYFFITAVVIILASLKTKAQTSTPDSVFVTETFGTGNSKTSLPAGRTTYAYNGSSSLSDGDYMIYKRTNGRPEWHDAPDHTGNTNGRCMVINAGMTAAEFYKDTVNNLVANTSYSVYLYIMNTNTLGTCGASALLPKLQFIVEYYNTATSSFVQLTTITTPFIPQASSPTWLVAGGTFINPAGNTTVRYRILNNSAGGCGNDLAIDDITFARASSIPSNPLPVTGMQLSAEVNGTAASLKWQTYTEMNTSHFITEKSMDALNWSAIDSVKAAGYSSSTRNYSSIDYKAGQVNYYRIKQVDLDGRYTFSNIVRVNVTETVNAKIYPNPFVSQVQLDLVAANAQKATIGINDMQGRRVVSKIWSLSKGSNSNVISEVKQLPAGMYFISVTAQDGSILFKSSIMKN